VEKITSYEDAAVKSITLHSEAEDSQPKLECVTTTIKISPTPTNTTTC
jgi:hypothetical protein